MTCHLTGAEFKIQRLSCRLIFPRPHSSRRLAFSTDFRHQDTRMNSTLSEPARRLTRVSSTRGMKLHLIQLPMCLNFPHSGNQILKVSHQIGDKNSSSHLTQRPCEFFSCKMGLEGLHNSYFTTWYIASYISQSFNQYRFLHFCSGFSSEDFQMVTELSITT